MRTEAQRKRHQEYMRAYRNKYPEKVRKGKARWYQENREATRERMVRWREQNKEAIKEYKRQYYQENKERVVQKRRERDQKNPMEPRAWRTTQTRKMRGEIVSPKTCLLCGSSEHIHAHHEDYARPKDIIWMCVMCHKKRHREIMAYEN